MKRLFSIGAAALLAAACAVPAARAADSATIYTWVDHNGVRHYSDHPGSADARALSLVTPATMPAPASVAPAPPSAPAPAIAAATVRKPVPLTQAQRAKLCRELQAEVTKLAPARRVQVSESGGKTRYLSGDDLVQYKAAVKRHMESVCQAAGGS